VALSRKRGGGSLEQSAIFVLFFCGLAVCLAVLEMFRMPKRSANAGKPLTACHSGFTTRTTFASVFEQ
jgi:hypothetical protein